MNPIGSNSVASQAYGGVQRKNTQEDTQRTSDQRRTEARAQSAHVEEKESFKLPASATPRGEWVLSEGASPQNFEPGAPRGTYLNVVV